MIKVGICSKVQSVVKECWCLMHTNTHPSAVYPWGTPRYRPTANNEGYTTVQTVLSVVSNLTAFASVGFMFVSYMGFSNEAWPFVFSWPAYPLYWTFGLVLKLWKRHMVRNQNIRTFRNLLLTHIWVYCLLFRYGGTTKTLEMLHKASNKISMMFSSNNGMWQMC